MSYLQMPDVDATTKTKKGKSMKTKEERTGIECPTNDFEVGNASGSCFGDGHYQCSDCVHYRADFKANGQDYIDFVHINQGGLQFNGINLLVI